MGIIKAVKFLLRSSEIIEEEKEQVRKVREDIKVMKTLNGEGRWMLTRHTTVDDCIEECKERF